MRAASFSLLSTIAYRPRLPHAQLCTAAHASGYHTPVLCAEAVEWLITDPAGTYVDGTLGGGGHSEALLEVLSSGGGRLIGVDRDPDALRAAGERLAPYVERGDASFVRSTFGDLRHTLPAALAGRDGAPGPGPAGATLDGLLLDLGVSSFQLDEPGRGFSYMRDGPLDMRMDQSAPSAAAGFAGAAPGGGGGDSSGGGGALGGAAGAGALTAAEILNEWTAADIADVLWRNGEERESRRIARAIVNARPLSSTAELAAVLKVAGSRREPKEVRNRMSRVFQALRIEVNQEIAQLEAVLTAAASLIKPGGRLAVMSYHSLEDRRVKRLLRSGGFGSEAPPKDHYGNVLAPWTPLTRRAVKARPEEVEANPRARSVRLRVGERTSHAA